MNPTTYSRFGKKSVTPGRRLIALCSAATLAFVLSGHSASAQGKAPDSLVKKSASDDAVVLDEFIVPGVRGSLITAQELKQNSLQFVDSIVAQDVGKLPDNSVADALQRIPGIQVGRGAGEVGTVLIRGLPNLGTTLNGEEIFTGTGRGVALQDIPAEMVAGVDVFKTTQPEHLEGGIAGLIDIRLRRPLDFKGFAFAGGLRDVYGETAKKNGLIGSVLVSDRWKTGSGGEFGALYSYSYQRRHFIDQTIFNFLFEPVGTGTLVPGQTDLQLPFTQGSLIIPGDRQRQAHNISLQWRPNSEVELYTDFLNTSYRDERQVHFNIGFPRFGAFTAATVYPGTNIPISLTSVNNFHLTSMQAFRDKTDGYQSVVGAKWTHGALKAGAEFIYNWNSVKHRAVIVDTRFAPPAAATFLFGFNNGGQADQRITGQDITSANNYYLWGLFDNHDYSTSEQKAVKADVEYTIGQGFLTSIKGGVRFSERDARFRGTTQNDIAPAGATGGDRFAATVPRASTIPGFGTVNPDGPLGGYGVPHWYTASPDFLYNNVGAVRQLFGQPVTDPLFNPSIGFTDTEKTMAGYVQAKYGAKPGGLPLDGVVGLRVVNTDQRLIGYRPSGAPLDGSEEQTDFLPSLNARLKLQDNLQLRFSAGRAITRPEFGDLNPATTLNAPTTTGGAAGTGSGGNPDLKTVRSDNYDLGIEYYFAKGSYVSLTGFDREIDGYVQSFAAVETIGGVRYIVGRPRNSGKGSLKGVEASYQHFPDFLPSFLSGLGWHTNVTYITGDTDSEDPTSTTSPRARTRLDYPQVSKWAYNLIGIYERGRFSTRLAYNWRGKYVDTFNGPNAPGSPLRTIRVKPTDMLDFSASYRLGDHFTITLDLTNLLNSKYQDYFSNDPRFARDTRAQDRTAALGVRFRY